VTTAREALERMGWRTSDGMQVAREEPYGATVVVRRGTDPEEFLMLRRRGGDADTDTDTDDWVWGPPAGARQPGETPEACARRELLEETGLQLAVRSLVSADPAWALFVADAPADAAVRLSDEHGGSAWLRLDAALARCRPVSVADGIRAAATSP
jgi:8-oxo-dGTP pyrophosphatase MutT (NUDIX family)